MSRKSGVEPCGNEHCRFPTRPRRTLLEDFPNTRQRMRGKCQKCFLTENPRAPRDRGNMKPLGEPDPALVATLAEYLRGRNAREAARARRMYPGTARRTA